MHRPDEAELASSGLEAADVTIELREEELLAKKLTIQVGLVRIRRELITETRTFEVTLSHEEISVERLPYEAGAAKPSGEAAMRVGSVGSPGARVLQPGETIRMPLVSEEIVVRKRPMVTSEVIIGKRVIEKVQSVSGTVRREEAHVSGSGYLEVEAQTNNDVSASGGAGPERA